MTLPPASFIRLRTPPTASDAPSRTAKPSKPRVIPRKGDSGLKWHSLWETMPSRTGLNSDSPSPTAAAEAFLAAHFQLTPRQAEVLNWVAEGKTNTEISIILECGVQTVKTHMKEIFQRLGVHSRTAAAGCAYRANLERLQNIIDSPEWVIPPSRKSA